ncbi:hypothetical protein Tco_0619879 [Tanacetum coccineum]
MANQEQIPQQQHQDEPQDQGTYISYDPAPQVEFEPNMINFKDNNEVSLIYLEHSNKNYFLKVSDFISKYCLREAFTRSTTMHKEYLVDFWYIAKIQESQIVGFSTPSGVTHGEVGLISFRNAIGANYLAHSRDYAQTPFIKDVRAWFPSIGYGEEIKTKGTLKKSFLPPRMEGHGTDNVTSIPTQIFSVNNLILKKGQPEGPPFTDHMLAICKADKPVAFKAPRTSSHTKKKDSQGKKPRAKSGHKKQSSLKHPSVSNIEATKGSQPLVSTPVVPGMHKQDQQATDDPNSLGVTRKVGAKPQLSSGMSTFTHIKPIFPASFIIHSESALGCDASADSTAEADPGKSAPNDSLPPQQGRDERNQKLFA